MKYILIAAVLGMSLSCNSSKKTAGKSKKEESISISEISQRIFDAIKELDQTALSTAVGGRFGDIKANNAGLVDTVINRVKDKLDEIPQLIWDDYKTFTLEHKDDPKTAVYVYKLPPITAELAQLQADDIKQNVDGDKKNTKEKNTEPARGQLIVLSAATTNFTMTAGTKLTNIFKTMKETFKKSMVTENDYAKVEKQIIDKAKEDVRLIFKEYYRKLLNERLDKL